ncbi:MAG: hypothetical protein WDN69_21915 [Aliidongia sp.]
MRLLPRLAKLVSLVSLAFTALPQTASAEPDPAEPEWYSLHGQITNVTQFHTSFASPFRGPNSLDPGNRGDETVSATLFAGIRIADGLEFYADPEIDQGFGLSSTLGLADFSSGEALKVGSRGLTSGCNAPSRAMSSGWAARPKRTTWPQSAGRQPSGRQCRPDRRQTLRDRHFRHQQLCS